MTGLSEVKSIKYAACHTVWAIRRENSPTSGLKKEEGNGLVEGDRKTVLTT